jgi:hypothetical protein
MNYLEIKKDNNQEIFAKKMAQNSKKLYFFQNWQHKNFSTQNFGFLVPKFCDAASVQKKLF